MKIAIMGVGAVGGYYGARLAAAGHEVTFIAREAHAAALRENGLHIRSELGNLDLAPLPVVTDTRHAGPVDYIVIAVKLKDTAVAARAILPMVGPETTILSLQNGVDKDEMIAGIVGQPHVIGAVTYIVAVQTSRGTVEHSGRLHRIVLGEFGGGPSPRVERMVAALRAAGIEAVPSLDIRKDTWEKFVFLSAISAVSAATRETFGPIRTHPATRGMLRAALEEGVALARAEGVALADDFGEERMRFVDSLPPGGRASMAWDLLRGQALELEWLSGSLVRRAERAGLAVPVHRTLYATLALQAGGSSERVGISGEPEPKS